MPATKTSTQSTKRILRLHDGSPVHVDEPDFWRFWKLELFLHKQWVCRRDEEGRIRRLHRDVVEATRSQIVQLLDGDRRNLTRANLHIVERSTLIRERPAQGACQYKGVSPYRGRWQATIRIEGKLKWLGAYESAEDAARAYDDAVRTFRGKSGRLNFPQRPRRRARSVA